MPCCCDDDKAESPEFRLTERQLKAWLHLPSCSARALALCFDEQEGLGLDDSGIRRLEKAISAGTAKSECAEHPDNQNGPILIKLAQSAVAIGNPDSFPWQNGVERV